ncbi:hypothetical protein [Celeribacter naphthalenivorans]|uniref:hypothetical protein n=1 Tax=Celeribacter naphthalenivorans TaxID=1614694 RepID=UPI001CFA9701|nr:hypothetical protein [Celeribacter naphthalenivorans]
MTLRKHALNAANIADKLTWATRTREVDGIKVIFVPCEEAEAMKDQLVSISHVLNDIADEQE